MREEFEWEALSKDFGAVVAGVSSAFIGSVRVWV